MTWARKIEPNPWIGTRKVCKKCGTERLWGERCAECYRSVCPNYHGVYLLYDEPFFKVGQSEGIANRLANIRVRYPRTVMHSYIPVPLTYLKYVETHVLVVAMEHDLYKHGGPLRTGDWFLLDEIGIREVQVAMMDFAWILQHEREREQSCA